MPDSNRFRPRTRLVHAGTLRSEFGEISESLFLTQSYLYPAAEAAEHRVSDAESSGYVYSRFANPTVDMFCNRLAAYEGAEAACAFASGMAAVTASIMCHVSAGDHVVASQGLFGSCRYVIADLLPRYGVKSTFVDGTDRSAWSRAMRPETCVCFLETPANPTLEVIDIRAVADIGHPAGATVIVDNALASPTCQHPLESGADLVVYSATKHIDGHGRCLGGAVLGSKEIVEDRVLPFLRHTGATLSPFNAWTFLKSLETLELRCHAQAINAARLADVFAGHAPFVRVIYPGREDHPQHQIASRQMINGGTLFTIEFRDGKTAAFRFLNALQLILLSNNLGDVKSLATHPATTTHQRLGPELRKRLGISDGLVRISCGVEDPEDLEEDVRQALEVAASGAGDPA